MPELEEFLARLVPYAFGERGQKVFEHNKKPVAVKVFACCLYLFWPSFEQTSALLADLVKAAKSAVWYWFQQASEEIGENFVQRKPRKYLVVDGTKIRTRTGQIWIYAATDPENRELVGVHVSKHRESIDVLQFLKRCLLHCEGKPVLVTDGGS